VCVGDLLGLSGHDIDRSHLVENIDITWRDGSVCSDCCVIAARQEGCSANREQETARTSRSLAGAALIADAHHANPTKTPKLLRTMMPGGKA
jgi:hypothetical protein